MLLRIFTREDLADAPGGMYAHDRSASWGCLVQSGGSWGPHGVIFVHAGAVKALLRAIFGLPGATLGLLDVIWQALGVHGGSVPPWIPFRYGGIMPWCHCFMLA